MNNNQKPEAPTCDAQPGLAVAHGSAKIQLWMVMGRDGKDQPWQPYAAYGSRLQAEVYASGCSDKNRVKIVAGAFSPNEKGQR